MNIRKLTGTALALVLLTAPSCGNADLGEDESVSLSGVEDIIRFAADPGDPVTFDISSNVGWSIVKKDLDWLSITPLKRLPETRRSTVTLSAVPNSGMESRTGTFEVSAGESFFRKFTVIQEASGNKPSFVVTGVEDGKVHFAADDIPTSFSVWSNTDWKAICEGLDWCAVTPADGGHDRGATITLAPAKNFSVAREGTLSFDYGGDSPYAIRLSQAAFVPVLRLSATSMKVSDAGKTDPAEIALTANGAWTAVCSECWMSVSPSSGDGNATITVNASVNEAEQARSATVTFNNHGLEAVLEVTQSPKIVQYVKVLPKDLAIPGDGSEVSFEVQSNTAWAVSASADWITVNPASGTGDATISVTATPNSTVSERTGTITVTATEVELLYDELSVSQEIYVDLSGWIDIYKERIEWICNSQSVAMATSPDFASPGQNGTVTGKATGVFYPATHADICEARFVKADNGFSYTTTFIIATEGHYAFKKFWTGDAVEFHVPVTKLEKGDILNFDFALRGTAGTQAYYTADASFDGGETFTLFDTGETNILSGGVIANTKIKASGKAQPYHSVQAVPKAMELEGIIVRIWVADGITRINGSAISQPDNGTLRLTNSSALGINGPTIYATKP